MTTFIFGEAMLEYHSHGGSGLRYGGDTLNTAIHLARAGHEVSYVTAVGTDPISDALVASWAREGIDTRFVLRHPKRGPGIYAIHVDDRGERSFLYWRDRSAAREMFALAGIEAALRATGSAKLLYFSLISLAILDADGRGRLLDAALRRKNARLAVAYDSNFRPSLWTDIVQARDCSGRAMQACTIGLPTNGDERDLWGSSETEGEIAQRWLAQGADMVVVKAAELGCFAATSVDPIPVRIPSVPTRVVDSSGAGDAFNGGFLASWLAGEELLASIETSQALARQTLLHEGAIRS